MKSIVIISSVCAMAFTGIGLSQETPAPVAETPAAAPAASVEVSKEAKETAGQMVALIQEVSDVLETVKDKATADVAAEKIVKINEKGEAIEKSCSEELKDELDAAMQAHQAQLLPIFMKLMTNMQRLQGQDFFGSSALKDAMEPTDPIEQNDVSEEEASTPVTK